MCVGLPCYSITSLNDILFTLWGQAVQNQSVSVISIFIQSVHIQNMGGINRTISCYYSRFEIIKVLRYAISYHSTQQLSISIVTSLAQ